jgi:cysteine synthase B
MGTTGTITGVSRYLKEQNPAVRIVGAQPRRARASPASASGPRPTCPRSTTRPQVDDLVLVSQADAEDMARRLARGRPVRRHLGRGRLLGGAAAGAAAENATIVFIVCDRGDRYLSTGVFPA